MAGTVDQLAFVLGAQTPLWSTVGELTRFASHVYELGPSLHRPFGSTPHPKATVLSTVPSAAEISRLWPAVGLEPLRIRAWRETPPGVSSDCVHVVVVNLWSNGAVRFTAAIEGLRGEFPGFEWPCSGYAVCSATRLFTLGPQLNISAGGILSEEWIGPAQTAHYRIGCDTTGGSTPGGAANMVQNPSFEQVHLLTHLTICMLLVRVDLTSGCFSLITRYASSPPTDTFILPRAFDADWRRPIAKCWPVASAIW